MLIAQFKVSTLSFYIEFFLYNCFLFLNFIDGNKNDLFLIVWLLFNYFYYHLQHSILDNFFFAQLEFALHWFIKIRF